MLLESDSFYQIQNLTDFQNLRQFQTFDFPFWKACFHHSSPSGSKKLATQK